jgi:hypothetical protein
MPAGGNMKIGAELECAETLADLLCYELCSGKLSPEMEAALGNHLEHCPSCRRRFQAFIALIKVEDHNFRNYG